MVSDMFMWLASPSGLRQPPPFSQPLFTFIYTYFLLLCDSAVMFRELKLVRGMRMEVREELKTGKAAQGGGFAPQDGRLEKPPA